ncbi:MULTISPECIES: hypothetical protein [unclassified Kitasatospora]|uniref:hypothetical protein n=1 Tax=unclassified Kitasatospora TaxID=2633591 RepID=UPI00070BF799|nr:MULTISPECIES: hypothetical protein [unclassified Kitasatospora]KQV19174.1 hypothetical protein ASC99_23700 [Kitasatospora sp. Root107]KRB75574.1 hypothetical protein ASE03_16670 [Kitasatospora sp. Root187]
MAGEYQVDPEAIRRFGRTSEERSTRVREIRSQLGEHRLPSGAFGKLPEADEIERDYQERHEAAVVNLISVADTMERISGHSEDLARSYEAAERGLAENMQVMARGLGA